MFRFMIRLAHALSVFGGRGVVGHIAHMLGMPPPTLPSKALGGGPSKHDLFGGKEKRCQLSVTPLCLNTIGTQQLLSHVK
jgi:hypothetical protein